MRAAIPLSVLGVGAIGPGFDNWQQLARQLLAHEPPNVIDTVVPKAMSLPSTERRRVGIPVRIALAAAEQAFSDAPVAPTQAQSVFASSSGDGTNCHILCDSLAQADRVLSPTKFTNSVHNAAAGYWGIATGSMKPSASLCSFNDSFVAGLLEAAGCVAIDEEPVVVVAFDAPYPSPLKEKRHIHDVMGVAMIIGPAFHEHALATLSVSAVQAYEPATPIAQPELAIVCQGIPAGRALPLLSAIAAKRSTRIVLDAMGQRSIVVEVAPCS